MTAGFSVVTNALTKVLGAQVLRSLGIHRIKVITNNPRKIVGLAGFGIAWSLRALIDALGFGIPALEALVLSCLAKDPADRWQKPLDLAQSLEIWSQGADLRRLVGTVRNAHLVQLLEQGLAFAHPQR